jgi:hypothetical protein
MSFVPNAMAHSGGMIPMSPFDAVLAGINSNPYFIGIMMLLLNLGGRFISLEMSKGQEAFFYNTWVRRSLIFIIIFVGTRNVLVALIMSSIIILCIGYLFNENSSFCILPNELKEFYNNIDEDVSHDDYVKAKTTIEKYMDQREETKCDCAKKLHTNK